MCAQRDRHLLKDIFVVVLFAAAARRVAENCFEIIKVLILKIGF